MSHRIAVVVFPGSNADWDALHAARDVLGFDAYTVFHKERDLGSPDAVILPGGFSYGDYLRAGAVARFSPIAEAVRAFANEGGPVLGICNGFQVLTEMGLLPWALCRNAQLRFTCRDVWVKLQAEGAFTGGLKGSLLRLPIAHAEGRYACDEETFAELEGEGRIAMRYCSPSGDTSQGHKVNGSIGAIAGIYNRGRNVLGLMPHPERAAEAILGNEDGRKIFESLGRCLDALQLDAREGAQS
jgi:phosphoribosylformylglycinamidine synthase